MRKRTREKRELEARLKEMHSRLEEKQFELDVVLKKYEGISETLSRTRAAIADALKDKYPLPRLRERFCIAKSTYYYHVSGTVESPKKKKDEERDALIIDIFMPAMKYTATEG